MSKSPFAGAAINCNAEIPANAMKSHSRLDDDAARAGRGEREAPVFSSRTLPSRARRTNYR
ncbi:MAG TPA: hypothetical protein VMB20_08000 [Candidatus Acidoferrum sp.]|nr:hypothetical protein [Candidatus Acidoferrum sp.]